MLLGLTLFLPPDDAKKPAAVAAPAAAHDWEQALNDELGALGVSLHCGAAVPDRGVTSLLRDSSSQVDGGDDFAAVEYTGTEEDLERELKDMLDEE